MSKKIDIVGAYLGNYLGSYTGRALARKLGINHQTMFNHVQELENKNILLSAKKGKNKEFMLNLKNMETQMFISLAETAKAILSLDHKELKVIIFDFLPNCEAIILFGSFASKTQHKNSDIDLIIIGKADKKKIRTIKERYPREINIEYATFTSFEKALFQKKALALEIAKNHVIYGDLSRVVTLFCKWYTR